MVHGNRHSNVLLQLLQLLQKRRICWWFYCWMVGFSCLIFGFLMNVQEYLQIMDDPFQQSIKSMKSMTWNAVSGNDNGNDNDDSAHRTQKLLFHLMLHDEEEEKQSSAEASEEGEAKKPVRQVDSKSLQQLAEDLWNKIRRLYYYHVDDTESQKNQTTEEPSYGGFPDGPVILGMERCAEFRRQWGSNGEIAVAGLFNTGTNALTKNIKLNLRMPGNNRTFYWFDEVYSQGIWPQAPWWKHNPNISDPSYGRRSDWKTHASVLPIVVVRDFYFWRKGTCASTYRLDWSNPNNDDDDDHHHVHEQRQCPVFSQRTATLERDGAAWAGKNHPQSSTIVEMTPVTFHLTDRFLRNRGQILNYTSLVQVWNSFYQQYIDATFPRLIIRFEDTLFHLPEILHAIQQCAGAQWKPLEDFSQDEQQNSMVFPEEEEEEEHESAPGPDNINAKRRIYVHHKPSKNHGSKQTNLLKSIQKSADASSRFFEMNALEQDYTRRTLDPTLMQLFHYTHPNNKSTTATMNTTT